jgi:hypothetical protein
MTLLDEIPYKKTIWVFGFVKTTISGSLISTGVVLIFNGITNHPLFRGWNEVAIFSGALAIASAIIVIASIDKWKEKKKKEELATIDKKFEDERKSMNAEREQMKIDFRDDAIEIARELVEKELEKLKEEV